MPIPEQPDEADIVKRPGVFLFGQYTVNVDKEQNENGERTATLPEELINTYLTRQQKQRIDDCHFRWRVQGDMIEIRESILYEQEALYAKYKRVQFPDGIVPLVFEKTKCGFDKVIIDAWKDHVMIGPAYKPKEDK